jgi:bacterioferritin-associated ferredoxin
MILCFCAGVNEETYKQWCHLETAPEIVLSAGNYCGMCKQLCDKIKQDKLKEVKNDKDN